MTNHSPTSTELDVWLEGICRSLPTPEMAAKLAELVRLMHTFHCKNGGDKDEAVLYCRGQQRKLLPRSVAMASVVQYPSSSTTVSWYDFIQIGIPRKSGPVLVSTLTQSQRRRFTTVALKVQSPNGRIGITDDTGYLFPCLQHYLPRACFLVQDHYGDDKNIGSMVFVLHGNKKFAGQGDDGMEEDGAATPVSSTENGNVRNRRQNVLCNPPTKCFPGTEDLTPTHYIFTWKANGKNAGVFSYSDPYDHDVWLMVNTKGVCECAGKLDEVVQDPWRAKSNWSDTTNNDHRALLPGIFQCFAANIWRTPAFHREGLRDLWKRGFSLLLEYCDNQHVVLERGEGGRPVNHLAFIGIIQQPMPLGSTVDTYQTGLVFHVDGKFTFEYWKKDLAAPSYTCKPTVQVPAQYLSQAVQEVMQGTFFREHYRAGIGGGDNHHTCLYEPSKQQDSIMVGADNDQNLANASLMGEGAVVYEMAPKMVEDGEEIITIRQLFKAKTASYITHRQFRGFLAKFKTKEAEAESTKSFGIFHARVVKFCRQKFGDLNPDHPYPPIQDFCSKSQDDIVQAASLFYAHFGMWLHDFAAALHTSVATLVNFTHPDILVPENSQVGQDYLVTAKMLGLLEDDILHDEVNGSTEESSSTTARVISLRCGFAFRVAEFSAIFNLDHALVFAEPRQIQKQLLKALDGANGCQFSRKPIPTGYEGALVVGFKLAFPDGAPNSPNNENDGEEGPQQKQPKKKKQKQQKCNRVLAPFEEAFRSFLFANRKVKLKIGKENPDKFVFLSSAGVPKELAMAGEMETFREMLFKLPSIDSGEQTQQPSRPAFRPLDAVALAVQSIMEVLWRSRDKRSCLRRLFPSKPLNVQFGDVSGRLLSILHQGGSEAGKERAMLIIRGVPGTGKSTVAKAFQHVLGGETSVAIVEADDYFGPNCPFHPDLLAAAHIDAHCRAKAALLDGKIDLVVVSNTSTAAFEYATYLRIAQDCDASVSILTLDTTAPLEEIQNVHEVSTEKVRKMANRLRHPDNNPEGKTLEAIFATAAEQDANKYRKTPGSFLVWSLLDLEGRALLDEIWNAFISFARSQSINVPDNIVRPPAPHFTQLFVGHTSSTEVFSLLSKLWDYHSTRQTLQLGEFRYCVSYLPESSTRDSHLRSTLVNLAVQVISFSPKIVDVEIPHITIAYDPCVTTAADSKQLWRYQDAHGRNLPGPCRAWDFIPNTSEICTTIESGLLHNNRLVHVVPDWCNLLK